MQILDGLKIGQRGAILSRRCRQNSARARGRDPATAALRQLRLWLILAAFANGLMLASGALAASSIELLVLGSGGPGATGRAGSGYLLLRDGKPRILVDAGPGSFARLGESGESLAQTDIVLLTHLHIDHAGELPGLIKARAVSSSGPIIFKIWGPDGAAASADRAYFPSTRHFIELQFGPQGAFAYLRDFAAPTTLEAHDIATHGATPAVPHIIHRESGLIIRAVAGHHGDAPAVIYRVDCAGKSVTFSGDIDAAGLPQLRQIARGSDLLVFDTVVLDPPGSAPVLYTLHTPPKTIGEIAQTAGVHQLLLSHLSPATDQMHEAVLDSVRESYAGKVQAAQDGMRVKP